MPCQPFEMPTSRWHIIRFHFLFVIFCEYVPLLPHVYLFIDSDTYTLCRCATAAAGENIGETFRINTIRWESDSRHSSSSFSSSHVSPINAFTDINIWVSLMSLSLSFSHFHYDNVPFAAGWLSLSIFIDSPDSEIKMQDSQRRDKILTLKAFSVSFQMVFL